MVQGKYKWTECTVDWATKLNCKFTKFKLMKLLIKIIFWFETTTHTPFMD